MCFIFKIGEFSRLTQVSVRMLRYYDENGLLKPAKTDHFTNYRLYSAAQIPELNKILFLRDLGFHISEIKDALAHWDNTAVTNLLDSKQAEIKRAIQTEQDKLARIEQAKHDISQEKIKLHCNVTMKSIPSYQVLSVRRVVADYYSEGYLWKEMAAFAEKNNLPVSSNTFTIYHDSDYREKDVDIEVCAPVSRLLEDAEGFTFRHTEPVPMMACTMVYGHFKNIAGAYQAFAKWLQEHSNYQMGSTSRQIVHRGPWNEENEDSYLTEIQIPLEIK